MKLLQYWYIIIALVAFAVCMAMAAQKFYRLPKSEKVANIKQWLLFAVIKAEKELGGGTGQLKLRLVYDWALERFKWLGIMPFGMFSGWVDDALDAMKAQLDNKKIKAYVDGE